MCDFLLPFINKVLLADETVLLPSLMPPVPWFLPRGLKDLGPWGEGSPSVAA